MLKSDKLSYWEYKTYLQDVDFAIIGAGIVGYSTALTLRKTYPESKIILLERGILPSGASTKNAGFACFGSATELFDDITNFGEERTWETVRMRWEGLQRLRSLIGDRNLKLEIKGSWDLITEADMELYAEVKRMLPEFNASLKAITGEENVYSIDDTLDARFGFKGVKTSFRNRLEGQIDTASMNTAFHRLAVASDIRTLFGCELYAFESDENRVSLNTDLGEIIVKNLIICTNGFAGNFLPEEVRPARAQVLVTEPIPGLKLEGTFHYQKGYYYFRNIDNRILLGGGRNLDFIGETTVDLDNTPRIMNALGSLLKTVILPDQDVKIDREWSGIMGVGDDKKPIVRTLAPGVFCGVRMGGMGVAIGTLVGEEIVGLIKKSRS